MRVLPLALLLVVTATAGVIGLACSDDDKTSAAPTTCDGGTCTAPDTNDAAVDDGGIPVDSAYPAGTTKIVLSESGGQGFAGADASTCMLEDRTYTYVPATGVLTWKVCVLLDGGTTDYDQSHKVLDDFEKIHIQGAFENLTVTTDGNCENDVTLKTVTFTSPSGDEAFISNDNKDCPTATGTEKYVAHTEDALGLLKSLSGND